MYGLILTARSQRFLVGRDHADDNRRLMRGIITILLAGVGSTWAETPTDHLRSMVESERNFYLEAQRKGTRPAFLDFFADDAIIFRPGPVNGKEVWRNRKTDLELIWEPTLAVISGNADLGYDTGPSKWRVDKSKEEWTYASYISIWKKRPDGSWKVAVDCATENPPPTAGPEPLQLKIPNEGNGARSDSFAELQTEFFTAARADFITAVDKFGSDDIRVYRDGAFPAAGKKMAIQALTAQSGGSNMEVMHTDISSSGDLAYHYGKYSKADSAPVSQGYFLQIWRTNSSGRWTLVLDWQQALPPEK